MRASSPPQARAYKNSSSVFTHLGDEPLTRVKINKHGNFDHSISTRNHGDDMVNVQAPTPEINENEPFSANMHTGKKIFTKDHVKLDDGKSRLFGNEPGPGSPAHIVQRSGKRMHGFATAVAHGGNQNLIQ